MAVLEHQAPKEAIENAYRLLPAVLDHTALVNPGRIYASIPRSVDLDEGLQDLTFADVSAAVDAFSWFLERELGRSDCFETLTYVGVDDLRFVVFFIACIKTGYKTLFISPRNTAEQNAHLINTTKCCHLFHSDEYSALAGQVMALTPDLSTRAMSPLDCWLSKEPVQYPYTKTFEDARYDPVLALHSSGSTGPPKTITQNHQFFVNYQREVPKTDERPVLGFNVYDNDEGGFVFSPFPFYHIGGVLVSCINPIYARSMALLMRHPARPPTAEMAFRLMQKRPVRVFHSPPSIIEDLARIPEGFELLRRVDHVIYGGGALSKSCGDLLSQHVLLGSRYGSTETGPLLCYFPQSDWQYFEFHPLAKVIFEEDLDGTYELVLHQDDHANRFRLIGGTILRTDSIFRTKDLFVQHPEKKGLWRFYGRKDDIIVFSTGQKWNPVPSEAHILSESKASGVLIVGDGRTEPAIMIELEVAETETQEALNSIWPAIQTANFHTQRYGRISRHRTTFVRPGSFARTAKGTIIRRASTKLLENLIDRLYDDSHANGANGLTEAGLDDNLLKQPLPPNITGLVRRCVHKLATVSTARDEDDLFLLGVDSLEAAEIARFLKQEFSGYSEPSSLQFIDSRFIFENATIAWLAKSILESLTSTSTSKRRTMTTASRLVSKYKAVFQEQMRRTDTAHGMKKIAITGTTGSLGAHILELLLADDHISHVLCLNRDPSAEAHFERDLYRGSSKASFLTIDTTKLELGLSTVGIVALSNVDAIIHCAWDVNFNRSLRTFEPQISAVAGLVKICMSAKQIPRVFFVSSMSAAAENSPEVLAGCEVPESLITEPEGSTRMGYATSKNVAEHVLAHASTSLGLPVSILRVGQIAGPTPDAHAAPPWNPNEWLPTLIATSKSLSQLPNDLPPIDWVPVNRCAQIILDIVQHDTENDDTLSIYNVVNPHQSRWQALLPRIQEILGQTLIEVSFFQWYKALTQHNDGQDSSLRKYPALKILPYFEQASRRSGKRQAASTTKACATSATLTSLAPIDGSQLKYWMEQWGY